MYDALKRVYRQRFYPIVCSFTKTENELAYRSGFQAIVNYSRIFFDIDFKARLGSLDHSSMISNAYRFVFPQITLILCWPHVFRAASSSKAKKRLNCLNNLDGILGDIQILHYATSIEKFEYMGSAFVRRWRNLPWNSWHVTASGKVYRR